MSITQPTTFSSFDAGSGTSVVIPQISGLAVNDLMLVSIFQQSSGSYPAQSTPPAGWSLVLSKQDGQGQSNRLTADVYWRMATSADVSASSYTFTGAGTVENQGTLVKVTGGQGAVPYVFSSVGATSSSIGIPAVTPSIASSLLMTYVYGTNVISSFTGNSIATSNPSWTTLYNSNPSSGLVALSTAIRPQVTATGTNTATVTNSNVQVGIMLGIAPVTIYTLSATAGSYSLSGIASAFKRILHAFLGFGTYALTGFGLREDRETGWTKQSKNNTAWTKQNK